ncbi:MAG TPA: hypothetical protein VM536_03350, partial [Chloroflexia bacterium]|nr:hypothetical protein [Chloroflexia bacterium]
MPIRRLAQGPSLFFLIVLVLNACGTRPTAPPPPVPPTRTPAPGETVIPPTAILVAPPTATPAPL